MKKYDLKQPTAPMEKKKHIIRKADLPMRKYVKSKIHNKLRFRKILTPTAAICIAAVAIADGETLPRDTSSPRLLGVSRTGFLTQPYDGIVSEDRQIRVFYWKSYGKAQIFEGSLNEDQWDFVRSTVLKAFDLRSQLAEANKRTGDSVSYEPDRFRFLLLCEDETLTVESDLFFAGQELSKAIGQMDVLFGKQAVKKIEGIFLFAKSLDGVFFAPDGSRKKEYKVLKEGGVDFRRIEDISSLSDREALEKALIQSPVLVEVDCKTAAQLTTKSGLKHDDHNYFEIDNKGYDILIIEGMPHKKEEEE